MSGTVHSIGAVPKVDHAAAVAEGLEGIARDIRAGTFAFPPSHCVVVLMERGASGGDVAHTYFGCDTSSAEVVGMLELAKLAAAQHDG